MKIPRVISVKQTIQLAKSMKIPWGSDQ
jgi:hypothetical protein